MLDDLIKNRKRSLSGSLDIHPDHPPGRIEIEFCVEVLNVKFRRNHFSGFGDLRCRKFCLFSLLWRAATARGDMSVIMCECVCV